MHFKSGENVTISEERENIFSTGKNKFSNETHKISSNVVYKISVTNDDNDKLYRKFKPAELQKNVR